MKTVSKFIESSFVWTRCVKFNFCQNREREREMWTDTCENNETTTTTSEL